MVRITTILHFARNRKNHHRRDYQKYDLLFHNKNFMCYTFYELIIS